MGIIVAALSLIFILFILFKIKNKKIKTVIIITLGIMIAITLFIIAVPKKIVITSVSDIQEREYHKVSNNLYYTDELIDEKDTRNDKEKILDYYIIISNYLKSKYPTLSFYIYNFNYNTLNDNNNYITFNLNQMIDMAIVDNTDFPITIGNNKIVEYDYKSIGFNEAENFIFNNIKLDKKANTDDVKKTALDLARKHIDVMFDAYDFPKVIKGECYLKYNNENKFYYTVVLNSSSTVKIDAITGEVIDSYFSDGKIY